MTDLHHLTLTSGHLRRSPRSEVSDEIIAVLQPIVRSGGGELAGLEIRMDPAPYPGGRAWTIGSTALPGAVSCVCCWSEQTAAAWWREAGALLGLREAPISGPPPLPWLAVMMRAAALTLPPAKLSMLGDAERCVAWCLILDAHA